MKTILFEDELVRQLYPITLSRPAFDISCGGYQLSDLANRLGEKPRALIRTHLRAVLEVERPELLELSEDAAQPALFINARLVPSAKIIEDLIGLVQAGKPAIVRWGKAVAAALVGPGNKPPQLDGTIYELSAWLENLKLPAAQIELPLFDYPHEVVRWHLQIFNDNLSDRLSKGGYQQIADGLFAANGAHTGKYCTIDAKKGPIILEENVSVGSYTYLSGPVHIGANTRIIEHSAIKHGMAIGKTCKIGGEVEGSIVESYTNKQHHGFLGHSYLGSWINIGAGTCNSDLKNTYGLINVEYHGRKVNTGMQFFGCVMGDYVKTAINTSIFTGKTIGVCSMLYGYVTSNVPSFVNYAQTLGQITEATPEVMITTQARMFARRNIMQRPCDVQLIHDMYELTRHETPPMNKGPAF